jgi:hypothetical protein
MGLWDDFYTQFNQKPILPTKPLPQVSATQGETQQGVHPLTQLIASLLAPRQQPIQAPGNNIASLVTALRNDPVGDYNRLSSLPSSAPGSLSPFNTGFFNNVQSAQVNAYPNQARKDYVAPTLPPARLGELYTKLYNDPRSLYQ